METTRNPLLTRSPGMKDIVATSEVFDFHHVGFPHPAARFPQTEN